MSKHYVTLWISKEANTLIQGVLFVRFTAGQAEMMAWWCEDLPLPPGTSYAWAKDSALQVLLNKAFLVF